MGVAKSALQAGSRPREAVASSALGETAVKRGSLARGVVLPGFGRPSALTLLLSPPTEILRALGKNPSGERSARRVQLPAR